MHVKHPDTWTNEQRSAWFDCESYARECERLRTLRSQPSANVAAINARLDTLEPEFAQAQARFNALA